MSEAYFESLSQASPSIQLLLLISGQWIATSDRRRCRPRRSSSSRRRPKVECGAGSGDRVEPASAIPSSPSAGQRCRFYRGGVGAVRLNARRRSTLRIDAPTSIRDRAHQMCGDVS